MTNNKRITVIIPAYNEEKYIGNCLQSVFLQTYPSDLIEIFVIDGGSTDKTVEIVKSFQNEYKNLRVYYNEKKSQSAAFNLGVEKANGEIIIRLDGHCLYDSNYIHYCVKNHSENIYGNVGGGISVIPGSKTVMGKTIALINNSPFGMGGATFRTGGKKKLVQTVPFGAFTKKVLSEVGKMNEVLIRGEDNDYNARIIKVGYKILFDPRIITYYYSRKNLKLFLQQMYNNGFSIGVLIYNSISSINLRHIVPLFFVLFLAMGAILSVFFPVIRVVFLSVLSFYFIINLISGLYMAIKKDIRIIPLWIYSVFFVHICYGTGTIIGLLKGQFRNN